ncbi:transporter substrate-binding domain-containing protein [Rhizobium leguminosarum]|uniref:transporter substrate-binding domain-containing protein n=1 Tax=Rhizobium leguminosarum TaxID=384 RepID=UPI001C9654F5|nr:transporter substrate-binding domain-containing protein [Rhizobium leguminosarum]MBY5762041.1 transporter substrate-binding domain-containing protein [Rhizobium leguminosarum]
MMHSENWRVGVLFSETGVTGAVEKTQKAATVLAIDEINAAGGVLGRAIEPIAYDPQSTPNLYKELAVKLCDEDRVRIVFGCHMSSTRKAVLPVIEARDALLFYPTLYEGFEYSRHCIYTGAAPNQNSVQLVDFLTEHYGKRVFLVGSNYVYPYESNRTISDLFLQLGGQVLDEMYVPLNLKTEDVAKIIRHIRAAQPDVIYSTIVGDGIIPFYTAFKEAGFDAAKMPIASQSTSEADVIRMRPEVAEGHITAAPFFASLDTPRARAFVSAYQQRYGLQMLPTAPAEAAYFQVYLYAAALQRAGGDGLEQLLPALYDVEYDAPQGAVKIDRMTNHTHLWPRVARVNPQGDYDIVYDPSLRVAPDPFMREYRPDLTQTFPHRVQV